MHDILEAICTNAGYSYVIHTAVDGNDGIHKAAAEHYDMVIADVHMPGKWDMSLVASLRIQVGAVQMVC